MLKQAFQDHYAPSITHALSERGNEQALRPKSTLLTESRQQQQAGQNSDRVKFKGFSSHKSAKHRGKSHSKARTDPATENLLILAVSIGQDPSHPIVILHSHEWFP